MRAKREKEVFSHKAVIDSEFWTEPLEKGTLELSSAEAKKTVAPKISESGKSETEEPRKVAPNACNIPSNPDTAFEGSLGRAQKGHRLAAVLGIIVIVGIFLFIWLGRGFLF